jgi:hypothetical protein
MTDQIVEKLGSGLVLVELGERRKMSEASRVWIGPGQVKVPAAVAEAWGLDVAGFSNPLPVPVEGYDTWTAKEIVAWAETASDSLRAAALAYEEANQKRKSVVAALTAEKAVATGESTLTTEEETPPQ